jgi:hypothetical protein
LDEDHYFADTSQCLQWFVGDAIQAHVDLFPGLFTVEPT